MKQTELHELFSCFREQCIWLRCCYNTYINIFESGDNIKEVLKNSAPIFFHDLNIILVEYIILQICKISDPAESWGHKNLTSDGMNIALKEKGLMTEEIENISSELKHYRDLIKESRNKLISHLDRRTVLNDVTMGENSKEEVENFFESLQLYFDAVGIAIGIEPLDFRSTAGPGDALDLVKKLKG